MKGFAECWLDGDAEPTMIQIPCDEGGNPKEYIVGRNCTRLERAVKTGEHCYIPYVRVWNGDRLEAEFSQHSLSGTYF